MIKHLAILVIYLVPPGDEWLLDLHLTHIRKHTHVPYTLYAVDNRLSPDCRARLEQEHNLRWVECPPTPAGEYEPDYYFTRLTQRARQDNPSHYVTLHVDSFPVADDWAETFAARLNDSQPFATVDGINTAMLFFTNEFLGATEPAYILTPEQTRDLAFRAYARGRNLVLHTGIGFVYQAWKRGWDFLELEGHPSQRQTLFCRVFDGRLFHLGGAARLNVVPPWLAKLTEWLVFPRWIQAGIKAIGWRMPLSPLRNKVIMLSLRLSTPVQAGPFQRARAALQRDPQAFIASRLNQK